MTDLVAYWPDKNVHFKYDYLVRFYFIYIIIINSVSIAIKTHYEPESHEMRIMTSIYFGISLGSNMIPISMSSGKRMLNVWVAVLALPSMVEMILAIVLNEQDVIAWTSLIKFVLFLLLSMSQDKMEIISHTALLQRGGRIRVVPEIVIISQATEYINQLIANAIRVNNATEDCSICLNKLTGLICKTKCLHTYHLNCLIECIASQTKNCPLCRTNLYE